MSILDQILGGGQARRQWVNRQGENALAAVKSALGPGFAPRVDSTVNALAMFNPVAGVGEAMQGGRQAYEGEGWGRVQGVGRALSGTAATVAPFAIAGTGAADDAARAVSEAFLGWSPARQGAADELSRFAMDESGVFAGINARTADLGALDMAKKMAREGADRDAIWRDTGWFQGVDGKWRFEIDDSLAEMDIVGAANEVDPGTKLTLGEVMNHSALFDAYPEIGETPTYLATAEQLNRAAPGAYGGVTKGGAVVLRDDIIDTGRPMHEVMHLIQRNEGFPTGGSPVDLGDEAYRNLPGELEAELVNLRASLTPEMRRKYPPWSMSPNPWQASDMPISEIVKKYGIAGAASLLGMSAADVEAAVGRQNNALRGAGGW